MACHYNIATHVSVLAVSYQCPSSFVLVFYYANVAAVVCLSLLRLSLQMLSPQCTLQEVKAGVVGIMSAWCASRQLLSIDY